MTKYWFHLYPEYRPNGFDLWYSFGGCFKLKCLDEFHLLLGGFGENGKAESVAGFRGLPEDMTMQTFMDATLQVGEYGKCIYPGTAADHVVNNKSHYLTNPDLPGLTFITIPEYNYHSWATLKEFEEALQYAYYENGNWISLCDEARALLVALRKLHSLGNEVRVVFWYQILCEIKQS